MALAQSTEEKILAKNVGIHDTDIFDVGAGIQQFADHLVVDWVAWIDCVWADVYALEILAGCQQIW
jgi:hypothetical protein